MPHVIPALDRDTAISRLDSKGDVPPLDVARTLYQLTEVLRVGCGHDDEMRVSRVLIVIGRMKQRKRVAVFRASLDRSHRHYPRYCQHSDRRNSYERRRRCPVRELILSSSVPLRWVYFSQ